MSKPASAGLGFLLRFYGVLLMAKRHERTRARSNAVQMLYTSEIQGKAASELLADGCCMVDAEPISDYAVRLIEGVEANMEAIDGYLADTSENWTISRMPIVDRSILRLATFEMIYVDEVPVSVSINEAVELAKDFGGKDESPSFVNGVLGRIARMIEAGETVADPAAMAVAEGESAADALEAALAGYDAFDETVEGGEISSEEAGE